MVIARKARTQNHSEGVFMKGRHILAAFLLAGVLHLPAQQPDPGTQAPPPAAGSPAPGTPSATGKPTTHPAPTKPSKPKKPASTPAKPAGNYFQDIVTVQPADPNHRGAKEIIELLKTPAPFSLKAGTDGESITIYCAADKPSACDVSLLQNIESNIRALNKKAIGNTFSEEVRVRHAGSLGDVVSKIQAMNYKGLMVEAAGPGKIRITRTTAVTDAEFENFQADIKRLSWQLKPEPFATRVYYLDAATASKALGGSTDDTKSSDKSAAGSGPTATVTVQTTATQTANATPCTPAKKSSPSDTTKSDATSPGSGSPTDDSSDSQNNCPPSASAPDGGSGTSKKAKGKSDSTSSVAVSPVSGDVLVFSDDNPGDDATIAERKRTLALIDFPRPEVIINTYSFQASSSNPEVVVKSATNLQNAIGSYNDSIQAAMFRAWLYLQTRIQGDNKADGAGDFFYKPFYDYLTKRFVAPPATDALPDIHLENWITEKVQSRNNYVLQVDPNERKIFGLCAANQYCLGYTSLFNPLRPNLTDMLFAVIASQKPSSEIRAAIEQMEGFKYEATNPLQKNNNSTNNNGTEDTSSAPENKKCGAKDICVPPTEWAKKTCDQKDVEIWKQPDQITHKVLPPLDGAWDNEPSDGNSSAAQSFSSIQQANSSKFAPRVFPMYCFREAVEIGFPVVPNDGYYGNSFAKPLRAALANFLYQYKTAQQYPHEFSGYELSQSAQELNSELNPLIVAFNRDLAAALQQIQTVARCKTVDNGKWGWEGHGTTFVDNGIITVRTVSGQDTIVDTQTQNSFDVTNPPSITDVISSVGQAESNIPKVLKTNLTANEAAVIIGALNSVKPTTSNIGREFKIDITPHSLSGASSAELNVSLLTGDVAPPTVYSGGKSDQENLSRISKSTVQTKVRLESIKLFEISSFTAALRQSRHNFPLLPPFVEIPYVGSLLSWPVPGATQYHRSTAVMSAVIVPTAADLASGVVFTHDRLLWQDGTEGRPICIWQDPKGKQLKNDVPCYTKNAVSLSDFLNAPISEFNKKMISCFSDPRPPIARGLKTDCNEITFDNVLPTGW